MADPRFEVVPGTQPGSKPEQVNAFEAVPRQTIAE